MDRVMIVGDLNGFFQQLDLLVFVDSSGNGFHVFRQVRWNKKAQHHMGGGRFRCNPKRYGSDRSEQFAVTQRFGEGCAPPCRRRP